jgi:hypothetical protein
LPDFIVSEEFMSDDFIVSEDFVSLPDGEAAGAPAALPLLPVEPLGLADGAVLVSVPVAEGELPLLSVLVLPVVDEPPALEPAAPDELPVPVPPAPCASAGAAANASATTSASAPIHVFIVLPPAAGLWVVSVRRRPQLA